MDCTLATRWVGGTPLTEAGRDLRLDFFRGLALFCIFIDHLPDNVVAQFTLQSLMFGDAAEVFILISGYTAGMVYGRAMDRQGFLIGAVRVGRRVWQLYVAHVFLFVIFMAMMAYTVEALNTSLYAEESHAADFLNDPGVAVVKALTLQFQPAYMDILPLYIVLLAALPFVLAGLRVWPAVVLFASFALWLAGQIDSRIALSGLSRAGSGLGFQPVWLAGAVLPRGVARVARHPRCAALARPPLAIPPRRGLRGGRIRDPLQLDAARPVPPIPALASGKLLWPFLSKEDLGLLRFASVLALALLVARLIPSRARFLAGRVAWPFVDLRAPLAPHLLSRDPARGDGAPGAQRVLWPRSRAARGLRGRASGS